MTRCGPVLQDQTSRSCDSLVSEAICQQHLSLLAHLCALPQRLACLPQTGCNLPAGHTPSEPLFPSTNNVQNTYCCASEEGRPNETITKSMVEVPQRTELLPGTVASLWAQLPKRLRQEDHLPLQVQDQPRYHNEMPGQIFNLSYSEMPFLSM